MAFDYTKKRAKFYELRATNDVASMAHIFHSYAQKINIDERDVVNCFTQACHSHNTDMVKFLFEDASVRQIMDLRTSQKELMSYFAHLCMSAPTDILEYVVDMSPIIKKDSQAFHQGIAYSIICHQAQNADYFLNRCEGVDFEHPLITEIIKNFPPDRLRPDMKAVLEAHMLNKGLKLDNAQNIQKTGFHKI